MKAIIKPVLQSLGYDLVRVPLPESHGRKLQELFDRFQINVVLDVGARHGEFASSLRAIGFKGFIASFEPVSTNFQALQANRGSDTNWQGFNMALGSQKTQLEINVTAGSAMSSFLKPNTYAKETFTEDSVVTRKEVVQVSTVADMLTEIRQRIPTPRCYLKLDTQGFDLEVFKGAVPVLDSVFALQSEVSMKPIYENMPPYMEAIKVYESHGFEVAGFFPVKHDEDGAVIEFDCVMLRRPKRT